MLDRVATKLPLEHNHLREAVMQKLVYRVICARFDERIVFDHLDKRAAIQVQAVMKSHGFRANWHGYLPAPESRVMS